MGEHVRAGDVDLWTERVGQYPTSCSSAVPDEFNARVDVFWRQVEAPS